METIRILSEKLREQVINRKPARFAPGRRQLRPIAEGLEVRSLLSVGLDPTFGTGGAANLYLPATSTSQPFISVDKIALQNGQVVAAGPEYGGTTDFLAVSRLTTGGTLDTAFASNGVDAISPSAVAGWTLSTTADAIAVQSNNEILVLTTATSGPTTDFALIRLYANGGLDPTFGNNSGIELFNFGANWSVDDADALAVGPTGTIVAAGTVSSSGTPSVMEFGVARLTAGGALDLSFNATGALPGTQEIAFNSGTSTGNATPVGVVVNSAGAIIVVGNVTPATIPTSPVSNIAVALVNANGSFSAETLPSFNANNDDTASAVALEGTQILIAGYSVVQFAPSLSTASNIDALTLTRLNANGTFDTAFNGTGVYTLPLTLGGVTYSTQGNSITQLSDGSLLVGGNAGPQWDSLNTGMLVYLTSNGTLNTPYGSNGVALLPTRLSGPLVVQSDGKMDFVTDGGVDRTTSPPPLIFPSPVLITTGTGYGTRVIGVTISFNTAVNPAMATNVALYRVRVGKRGRYFIGIRRAIYNASNNSVTLVFRGANRLSRQGYEVAIAGSTGIVEAGAQVLNNGSSILIYIPPTATT